MDDVPARQLGDFLGRWRLQREILQDDGAKARFEGTAYWRLGGAEADYIEEGHLVVPGQGRFAAHRRYIWDKDLNVCFEDGRFFHQVPATGGTAQHWCSPDTYRVAYDFSRWPRWQAVWRVDGPRKAYSMVSVYRCAAA